MEAAVLSEHSRGLALMKSGFYSYLCSGHWKSILLCLTSLHLQDLHLYAEAFFIVYEILSHDLGISHVFIYVILIIVNSQ